MQDKGIIVKTRRQYITIVLVSAFALGLFVFSPKGNYLWPIAVLILAPLFFFHRYADFYADCMVITYPVRRKKITISYRDIQQARFRPAVLRNPPAVSVWFKQNGKQKKFSFEIDRNDGLLAIDLVKVNSPATVILDPWDDKPLKQR